MKKNGNISLDSQTILDSLNDGVYVVDKNRKVVYWSSSAERITGWLSDDVLGKRCLDSILCHIDKDGHHLCGKEHCPLHRAMVTNQSSVSTIILFAKSKDDRRIPMRVSVAPICNSSGEVIGGVETFRDLSGQYGDLQRAKDIQSLCLQNYLDNDERICFKTHYVPHDIIGGDFYAITRLNPDCYGFILADVSGHGVSAALYTMYINSLWQDNNQFMSSGPRILAEVMNVKFCNLRKDNAHFATGIFGVIDLKREKLRLVSAGNPPPLLFHNKSEYEQINCSGLPLGLMDDANYEENVVDVKKGDSLLLYTDGAVEIQDVNKNQLDVKGLVKILKELGYPKTHTDFKVIEEAMLKYSNRIRFDDDLTFLEMRLI
jgi:PAS domain S-box-containing protein